MLDANHTTRVSDMRHALKYVFAIAVLALAAGCSSAPKKRINPPRASIQQLAVQADGSWQLSVRLQNFSNISTAFASVDAKLVVGGQDAGQVALSPGITVGPESADVVVARLAPALGAKLAVASALSSGQSTAYSLSGTIATSDPKGSYHFSYDSTLNPAPGLNGVLR
jgi:hypothetical protein